MKDLIMKECGVDVKDGAPVERVLVAFELLVSATKVSVLDLFTAQSGEVDHCFGTTSPVQDHHPVLS